MGATIIEKILARTSGAAVVGPGEIAVCRPDIVVQLDMPFYVDGFWYRPKKVYDPDRIAIIFDHGMPAPTIKEASGMAEGRRFAREFGLKHVYDFGRHGISHVVAAEKGLARPGELLVNCDSHSCAAGALNCAARGAGPLDALQAMTQGLVWYPVTPTIRYEFTGALAPTVSGKDVFFHIAQVYGGHSNMSVEFGGPGLAALAMNERRTIATMCAEIGAEFALFEYDAITAEYLEGRIDRPAEPVAPDADAEYADRRVIDLAEVEPYVMLPHAVPNNGVPISRFDREVAIDQAFIGSCANGQIEDIRIAAGIVAGRQVAPGVRLIVTPGSQDIYLQAVREGLVETLTVAGAVVTNSTCGACLGYHMGVLAPGEVCLTASTRNFKGRMGSSQAEIYMGSPATVAASAIAGVITDPRGSIAGTA
ncbi:aconitase/3-isopropylmalate dehydratase large subunit family protein [Afifella sp. IM 167]|uniref:3-isopropylmalate dehydratase large subunit n=1 Tax=Afifella sp. IM 167 TaxID=2033586 RepID=UPI001CCC9056|nr:aconitase/3-isopropylmalate dehydratase large subunit family protein [Afifella sp. IM 167]MBZ8134783.1 3-isopropylmalate dehydratase [Afifella sp. IM 167]